uniref:Katanin p80 WD40 repeat-containing subunit B1 n=1 Tax=Cynoglossus semilaevis TaxID=244447 RepID=A0A3P8X168_CYNSE
MQHQPAFLSKAWKFFEAHSSKVSCLALGKSSSRLLATGGDDCRVNIWTVSKANCIMSLTGPKNPVECVQFNTSEEQVVAGSQSGSVLIWDLQAAKILRTLMGHKASITSLGFHPFGDFLASSSMDTNIKLWDVRRKGYVFRYKGHTQTVRSLAFSPDGKWLASAGDDCTVKLWDLTQGKTITEFKSHTAAVNIVQFHPNEYLLASGSCDSTIKLWDLEKFVMVVLLVQKTCCLYSGSKDSLRVFGWEPDRCFDVVNVGWGRVSDLAVCNQQLIGVSHQLSSVSSYVVDLKRIKQSSGSVIKGIVQNNEPLAEPKDVKGAALRKSYERPTTTCGSQRYRRSPSEDEADEKTSSAEIHNAEDHKEIFQPKNHISSSTPVQRVEPTVISSVHPQVSSTVGPKSCYPPPSPQPAVITARPTTQTNIIPCSRNESIGLNVADFLLFCPNNKRAALTDDEALSQIKKGHDTMCVMLSSRLKNLETVRAVWIREDVKSALESAVSMNDLSIVVDILNIINLQPTVWKLDLCTTVLPQLDKLLQSKYESYMQTGCTSLKLVMKHFWMLIADTLKAVPSVGVDITREERHLKCRLCYKQLKSLGNITKIKAAQVGRHGSTFKELQLLMEPLNDTP